MFTMLWMSVRELQRFIITVIGVVLCAVAIIYAKLWYTMITDMIGNDQQIAVVPGSEYHAVAAIDSQPHYETDMNFVTTHFRLDLMQKDNIHAQPLVFTTLPPGHWVVVESLGIKAPIVDVAYADHEKLEKGDFYEELKSGVVRYPYTAIPGEQKLGNSVIFGHSSTELRDHGSYGQVFQKLPKITVGETIKVIWDGKLYAYEVDHKVIKRPKDVAKELSSWNDDRYLTLMACYPLLSDAQRILVRGKLVPLHQQGIALQDNNNNG